MLGPEHFFFDRRDSQRSPLLRSWVKCRALAAALTRRFGLAKLTLAGRERRGGHRQPCANDQNASSDHAIAHAWLRPQLEPRHNLRDKAIQELVSRAFPICRAL